MALYEYQCENCGEVFELIQKFSDEPLVIHEKCGGTVHRLISAPALKFKGTGWYVTDYAKGGSSSEKGGSSSEKGGSSSDNGESKKKDTPAAGSSTSSASSDSTAKSGAGSSAESKSTSSDSK